MIKKIKNYSLLLSISLLLLFSHQGCDETSPLIESFNPEGEYLLHFEDMPVINSENDIRLSGFTGLHYKGQRDFYTITKRGPVLSNTSEAYYLSKDFIPEIVLLELQDDNSIKVKERKPLQISWGETINGCSPSLPWGSSENVINTDFENCEWGINPGGLHYNAKKQIFWISDLYAPGVFSATEEDGTVYKRMRPGEGLRKVYSNRINNGGLSGITFKNDDICYATMKYNLNNRKPDDNTSEIDYSVRRIAKVDITKHKNDFPSSELSMIYLVEDESFDGIPAKEVALGDVLFLNDTTLIVSEYADFKGATRSLLYAAVITDSTSELLDGFESIAGKTIETLTAEERADKDSKIIPFKKRLIADLTGYGIDKPEGLALINNKILAVLNDDDFGISNGDPASKSFTRGNNKTKLVIIHLED